MDFAAVFLKDFDDGQVFVGVGDEFVIAEADDIADGGFVVPVVHFDGVEALEVICGEDVLAAEDAAGADGAHGAAEVEVAVGHVDGADFVVHFFEEGGELIGAGLVGAFGNADEGDIAGEDEIAAFDEAWGFNFAEAGFVEGFKEFGHPDFFAASGLESHAELDESAGGDEGDIADKDGIGMVGEFGGVEDFGAEIGHDGFQAVMLHFGLMGVGDFIHALGFEVRDLEILFLRGADDNTAEAVSFVI